MLELCVFHCRQPYCFSAVRDTLDLVDVVGATESVAVDDCANIADSRCTANALGALKLPRLRWQMYHFNHAQLSKWRLPFMRPLEDVFAWLLAICCT